MTFLEFFVFNLNSDFGWLWGWRGERGHFMFQYLEFKVSCVFEMQVMSCFFAELNEGPNFVMSALAKLEFSMGSKVLWESKISGELKEFGQVVK